MYIPFYSKFTIDTRLTQAEAYDKLSPLVASNTIPLWIPFGSVFTMLFTRHGEGERYQGYLGRSRFSLVRHTTWNSGGVLVQMGVVQGHYYEHRVGTRVDIVVRPHFWMVAILFFGLVLTALAVMRVVPEMHDAKGIFAGFFAFAFLALFWGAAVSLHRQQAHAEQQFWTALFAGTQSRAGQM